MDQKWTKRQNERPPASPEIELRPFRKQVTILTWDLFNIGPKIKQVHKAKKGSE